MYVMVSLLLNNRKKIFLKNLKISVFECLVTYRPNHQLINLQRTEVLTNKVNKHCSIKSQHIENNMVVFFYIKDKDKLSNSLLHSMVFIMLFFNALKGLIEIISRLPHSLP